MTLRLNLHTIIQLLNKLFGTWINGKPLYEKVLTGTLGTYSTGTGTVQNDILVHTNADFTMVKQCFLYTTGNVGKPIAITYYQYDSGLDENVSKGINYSIRTFNTVRITQQDSSNNGATYYAVVNYTKSTDTI